MKPRDFMACKSDLGRFVDAAGGWANVLYSLKLDGVRVVAVVEQDGKVTYWSRNKKPFANFKCFDEALREYARRSRLLHPVVFDGEVTGGATFADVMTQVHRTKDVDDSNLVFNVFDIWAEAPQVKRFAMLDSLFAQYEAPNVRLLNHGYLPKRHRSEEGIASLMATVCSHGFEGLVLKAAQAPYENKRSVYWCKVKPNHTVDLAVTGFVMGSGKHEGKIGALVCEYNRKRVQVGTGFSDEQRLQFLQELPKLIEVRYQEKTPAGVLRFPAFVRVRDDKNETDGGGANGL